MFDIDLFLVTKTVCCKTVLVEAASIHLLSLAGYGLETFTCLTLTYTDN
jgi:hypothetical protein